jgi:hypothetical protein
VHLPPALCAGQVEALASDSDGGHRAPLADRVHDRLLEIHVLARLHGEDGLRRVPRIVGGDDHRVYVLVLEQLAEVAVAARLRRPGLGLVDALLPDVAQGAHLDVARRGEARIDLAVVHASGREGLDVVARATNETSHEHPAAAAADEADVHAVVGAADAARGEGGER